MEAIVKHLKVLMPISLILLMVAGVFAVATFGQAETGTISGTVTDQSGGVVPKAKVTVTNTATGAQRVLETDNYGFYNASNLLPGIYSVSVEAANLAKKEARTQVTVGSRIELNFQLTVGATSTVVEVSGEGGVQVNTETATSGRGVGVSFNGLRSAGTNILLDGAANNDEFTATVGRRFPWIPLRNTAS